MCGVTQATISELENGKANPTLDVILKISGALGTPPSALLGAGALLGTVGVAIGGSLAGAVVAALLATSLNPALKEWVTTKLLEGLLEGFGSKENTEGG